MNKSFIKKYGTLLLLAAGAGIIFQLPYIRETFYVPIQNAMNLTDAQMGMLSSGYATMATFSYFVGGIVADKFSARKLLAFSFIATGILGLWFSTFPGYNISRLIFVLMGVSTVITYWSACIKATRLLGDSSEQGRLFGLQEGLRGVINALVVFVMSAAGTLIVLGILHYIVIEDTKSEKTESIATVTKGMFKCLLIPRVWVLIGIIFTAYSVYGLIGYVTTFAQRFFGMTAATAATLGGVRYLLQGAGGIIGGFLADKFSRGKVIAIGCVGLAVSFVAYVFIPGNTSALAVVIANFFIGLVFIYAVRSQYFAIQDDAGIPIELSGRVSGITSAIGYLPDVFMYTLVGSWMDSYGRTGFNMTWIYAAVAAVLCIVMVVLLNVIIKKNPKSIEE